MTPTLSERARELGAWLRQKQLQYQTRADSWLATFDKDNPALLAKASEYESRAETVSALLAEREWRAIDDDAPYGPSIVFVDFCNPELPGAGAVIIAIKDDSGWRDDNDDRIGGFHRVTHFLPVPLPPPPNPNPAESLQQGEGAKSGKPHNERTVSVLVDVDEAVADIVLYLNTIPGIRTHASCQGTVGEGGPHPYGPYVMVSWRTPEAFERINREFDISDLHDAWCHVHPRTNPNPAESDSASVTVKE